MINGISSEEKLRQKYPFARVLNSYFIGHSAMRVDEKFYQDGNGKIVYLVGENDYRNITTEMATRLSAAFCATRHDFENMDNSVLEEKIDMLNGNIHQRVNNDDKIYDDR